MFSVSIGLFIREIDSIQVRVRVRVTWAQLILSFSSLALCLLWTMTKSFANIFSHFLNDGI